MTAPAASHVSRVLGRRFTRSVSHGTRVRGITSANAGFTVYTDGDHVRVEHQTASGYAGLRDYDAEAHNARVQAYADHLAAAGFDVEVHANGRSTSAHDTQTHVRVTRKDPA